MCDCPIAGVFTSHEAYRSWIIFKECKTDSGTANTIQAGVQSSSESSHQTNQDLSNMYVLLDSLDPHLRPATPDFTNPNSVALYEEHKKLAEDYWKLETELVLATQRKNQLLAAQEEDQRRQMRLKKLQEEKESLMLARDLLRQQKESRSSAVGNSSRNSGDGWVIIPRHQDHGES